MMDEKEARRLLGQIFALRRPKSWSRLDLDRFPVANYILFGEDLRSSFDASRSQIHNDRVFLHSRGIEPLFMMDEEGGRVSQISGFFPSAPSPRAISGALTAEEAGSLYGEIGACLGSLGIDLNLFPCLDVNTEPLNPIIGTRAFGNTVGEVNSFGQAALSQSRGHIRCVGKHFPGHGMTGTDSHLGLPIVAEDAEALKRIHIPPFREAIKLGIDCLMVSHCNYSHLQDDGLPASLSADVVGSMLRDALGYQGLVMTDSLDMQAVTTTVNAGRVGWMAIDAGCDILLHTEYSERFEASFEALVGMVASGDPQEARLRISIERRNRILKRPQEADKSITGAPADVYLRLRDKTLAGAVEIEDPRLILPFRPGQVAILSTAADIIGKLRACCPSVRRIDEYSNTTDVTGCLLVLWLMEPLRLRLSPEQMRTLMGRAKCSILVTTYDAFRKILPPCDVTVISKDTSSRTDDAIIGSLFGAGA
jgi:beta-glucosidase-like glycosyl hydrolase